MRDPYRVAVAGPGGLGACAIRELTRLNEYQLMAVLAYSPNKHGVDAGTLAGIDPVGVTATTDFKSLLNSDAECVVYTARDFGDWRADNEILALLEAGKNIVTPLPYHYLKTRGPEVEAKFLDAARRGKSTLHGSGITPGFYNERLALLMTGLTNDVQHIKFQEFFNAEPLAGALETLQLFGFGSSLAQVEANPFAGNMAENYLKQPIIFYADQLGIPIERIERRSQHQLAPMGLTMPATTIAAGTVGCVSYAWTAYSAGKPFYTTEVYWFLGDVMRPAAATANDFWTIEIEGRPSLKVSVASQASYAENLYVRPNEPAPAGYLSSVVAMVQAIPRVIDAAPGFLLPTLPQFHWKPDQRGESTVTEFLSQLGFNLTTPMGVFWLCTAWTFFIITVIWIIGNFQTDHSMMDGYYGFGYAIPAWIAYLATSPSSATSAVLLTITSLHGCRLGYYLSNRWVGYQKAWGHGDQRYMGFTKKFSPGYWWKSFFVVMEPQAIVIALIGIPATIGIASNTQPAGPLSALGVLGIFVFGVGFYFETVADGQLQAFKADANNKGRYLRTGVWTYTRHPNYFGNTVVWWGIWLVAVAGDHAIWWTVIGPLFNTIMLTGILGRAFQDKFMGVRPEYKKVMEETNSFLPIPKRPAVK